MLCLEGTECIYEDKSEPVNGTCSEFLFTLTSTNFLFHHFWKINKIDKTVSIQSMYLDNISSTNEEYIACHLSMWNNNFKTHHPMSRNSHPSATVNKARHCLKSGGVIKPTGRHITLTKYEAVKKWKYLINILEW